MASDDELWGDPEDDKDMKEILQQVEAIERASVSPAQSPAKASFTDTDGHRGRSSAAKRPAPAKEYRETSVSTERVSRHAAGTRQPRPIKLVKTSSGDNKTSSGDNTMFSPSRTTRSPVAMRPDEIKMEDEDEEEEVIETLMDTDSESSEVPTRTNSFSYYDSRTTSMTSVDSGSKAQVISPRQPPNMYPSLSSVMEHSPTPVRRTATAPVGYGNRLEPLKLPEPHSSRTAPAPLEYPNRMLPPPSSTRASSSHKPQRTPVTPADRQDKLDPLAVPAAPSSARKIFPRQQDLGDVFFSPPPAASPSRTGSEASDPRSPFRAAKSIVPDGSATPTRPKLVEGSSRDGARVHRCASPDKSPERKPAPQPLTKSYTTGDIAGRSNVSAPAPAKSPSDVPSPHEPDPVVDIFAGKLELARVVIAHAATLQPQLEKLAWGVQYEIARGVTCGQWKWEDLTTDKLGQLKGSNAEAAYKVIPVMRGLPVPDMKSSKLTIWREMDREQAAILENRGRGLGLMGDWDDQSNWYGGKIQQVVRLSKVEGSKTPEYKISLDKLEMRRSNRFARFLGSRRLLALHVPDKLLREEGDDIRAFLRSKFVLLGRTFVTLHAKDGKIYMVEISEDYERRPNTQQGDNNRLSLEEIIRWYNPLDRNPKQPISKWTTRFALGFSTSVPVLQFEPQHIIFIRDRFAEGFTKETADAEHTMTDGCGFVSASVLLDIKNRMGYSNPPTAVQGRIAGSKGLWIAHPDPLYRDPNGPRIIWVRDSQKKIVLPDFSNVHRAHLIFDLVCPNRFLHPARLSMQTVLNLSHNGVPTEVFATAMADSLREEVAKLTKWDGPNAIMLLIDAIDKAGRVSGTKLQRLAGGMSRALGFSGRERREDVEEENPFNTFDDDGDDTFDAEFGFDPQSAPVSVHESAVELLKAGFHPLKLQLLWDKVKDILIRKIESEMLGYHINIAQSVEVFVVPDPFHILKEGEVYMRSNQGFEGMFTDTLEGPVLLSRNPTRVPSDVQKVTAVRCPQLADYSNLLVVSCKGKRSLASYLAGGDYDGDTVMVVWDQNFVRPFCNADLVVPEENFISENFHRDIEKVPDFLNRIARQRRSQCHSELLRVLLQGMADRKVGIYSMYHDITVHTYGLADARTVRLAHMFTHLLDSDKTGLRPKEEVVKADRRQFGAAVPDCMKKDVDPDMEQFGQKIRLRRRKELGPCVLCQLMDAGKEEKEQLLIKYNQHKDKLSERDEDVIGPWDDANRRAASNAPGAEVLKSDMAIVRAHVDRALEAWRNVSWNDFAKSPIKSLGKRSKGGGTTKKSRQETVDGIAAQFHEAPAGISIVTSANEVRRWKVGYAMKQNPKFAFAVAFWDVCGIKAEAKGRSTATAAIASLSNIPPSVLKVLQPAEDP